MGGWSQQIDIYCERMGPEFWAEPVNAVTNAAFLIAAGWVLVVLRREGRLEAGTGLLLALLTAIGIGSFLFHTVATRWAALADVLPIMLFILAYLALTMRRGFRLTWWWAGGITLAFLPASFAVSSAVGALAGGALGGLVVRGAAPDQNLYLLDGAPVYHPWHTLIWWRRRSLF